MYALAIAVLVLGGVQKGGKLFIKGSGVNMTDKADGTGKKTALKAGDEVIWEGPDANDKLIHRITVKGKPGYVPMSALTPNRPSDEVVSTDGKTSNAAAFASSRKPEAGLAYAVGPGPEQKEAAARLLLLRASSELQKAKVAEHVKAQGLGGTR